VAADALAEPLYISMVTIGWGDFWAGRHVAAVLTFSRLLEQAPEASRGLSISFPPVLRPDVSEQQIFVFNQSSVEGDSRSIGR
jgi:hypothetical protein